MKGARKPQAATGKPSRKARQSQTGTLQRVSEAQKDVNHQKGDPERSTGQEIAKTGESQEVAIQSNPEQSKGLDFVKTEMASAPRKREGGAIQVVSSKTREQLCDELCCEIEKAAGVPLEVADRVASQMANAMVWPRPTNQTESIIKAITALAEYAPRNAIEASLAAQMTATGEMALMFLNRAALPEQTIDGVDRNVVRANRLMRLHLEQIEAMQKLQGKSGQQKVTVEHVHVHEGGQAIVGAVSTPKGGGGGE